MSTIRWVDLLSSESNLSHSVANNEDVAEKAKKKKFPYDQERDLNSSFLNSYNGDLDNSNVGINLKIKNMSIVEEEKEEKQEKEKSLLGGSKTTGQMTHWRDVNEGERGCPPSAAPNGEITHTAEGESGKSTEGVPPKGAKEENTSGDNKTNSLRNVVEEEKDHVSEKLVSLVNLVSLVSPSQEEKTIPKEDSPKEPPNGDTALEKRNKTGKNCPNVGKNPTEENAKKDPTNRVSVQSGSGQSASESAKKVSERRPSAGKKNKKNPSNGTALTKGSRSNRIKNVSVGKEAIQNSYFARYIVKKGGGRSVPGDTVPGDAVPGGSLLLKAANEGEVSRGKKRKDRALLCENSTASKFNCTLSHDVTVDDSNVPLNPAKKARGRTKEAAGEAAGEAVKETAKEGAAAAMEAIKEGTAAANAVPAPPGNPPRDGATNVVTKSATAGAPPVAEQSSNHLGIAQNMPSPPKCNLPPPNHHQHLSSDNINLEKFKNFDANFINYLGDIRSHFSDPFVSSNSNRVNSRLKEIAVGKSTKEYKNYVKVVKYEERMDDDPSTPNAYENVTNAKFQAKYNLWRKKLHRFDSIG